jgi:cobalt-zinc-cadmium efflux system protein
MESHASVHAHAEGHAHEHSHGGGLLHGHFVSSGSMQKVLQGAVVASGLLVAAEIIGGSLAGSLAVVSDGVHNLTDMPALLISWFAVRMAERPPTPEKTYGYHRAGILAAFTNALLLVGVSLFLFYAAIGRLLVPVEVHTGVMIWMSLLALGVNGGVTLALVRGRRDLNLRSVLIHNAGDALSNLGILAGAVLIGWTGAGWIDPLLGMGIGALILWSCAHVLRESSHILLEGLPRQIRLEDVARGILGVEGVQEVHDIHIWTLGTDLLALSCHIRIPDMHMEESEKILAGVREILAREFHITHTTIQFERAGLPATAEFIMPAPFKAP